MDDGTTVRIWRLFFASPATRGTVLLQSRSHSGLGLQRDVRNLVKVVHSDRWATEGRVVVHDSRGAVIVTLAQSEPGRLARTHTTKAHDAQGREHVLRRRLHSCTLLPGWCPHCFFQSSPAAEMSASNNRLAGLYIDTVFKIKV